MPARFLISGAHRETGRPASLVLEALTQADAEAEAHRRGVMISDIQTLPGGDPAPPAIAPSAAPASSRIAGAPASRPVPSPMPQPLPEAAEAVTPEPASTSYTPSFAEGDPIALPWPRAGHIPALPGERELDRYEAKGMELGLRASILRHRRAMILTNRRVIACEKRAIGMRIQTLFLEKIEGAVVGSRVNKWLLLIGVASLIGTAMMYQGLLSLSADAMAMATAGGASDAGGSPIGLSFGDMLGGIQASIAFVALFQLAVCIVIIYAAFSREMVALGGGSNCGILARWLRISRARAFLDNLQHEADRFAPRPGA